MVQIIILAFPDGIGCCDYRVLKLEDVSERIYSFVEKVLRKIR